MLIKAEIRGLSPILINRFTEENEAAVSSGTRVSLRAKDRLPRDVAEDKLYKDKLGNLYLPGNMIFACLIAAGTFHKVGKSKMTTQKTSLIPAGISIMDLVCPLEHKGWEVDSRAVVIPSTGGRVMAHRPRLDDWNCKFVLDVDADMFSERTVRVLLEDAGKKIGLGDFRPSRKGPFGRFSTTSWETAVN